METYCISCKKYTANENSSCEVCGKKKWTLIKNQELHNFNDI